ncbi:MAG TPA: c-type cytochrome [Gammaproteobacteria bacterium]
MSTNPRVVSASFAVKAAAFAAFAVVSGSLLAQQASAPPAPLAPLTLKGHPEHGRGLAATCAGCHSIPGYRNVYPSFHVPKLGGQNADYIEVALQGYRRGTRGHDTMHAQAAKLSDQDIADIAAYIASLENSAEEGISRASEEMVVAGKEKAAVCFACHGEAGIAPDPRYPNLAGQHASYLERALRQYKSGERQDITMAPMAAMLDETAIEEVAAYFAAQPGLYTPNEM